MVSSATNDRDNTAENTAGAISLKDVINIIGTWLELQHDQTDARAVFLTEDYEGNGLFDEVKITGTVNLYQLATMFASHRPRRSVRS